MGAMLKKDGLFGKANEASKKYSEEKASEELALALSNALITKYSKEGLNDEKLNAMLNKIGQIDDEDNTKVTVGGYVFIINRDTLKIEECIGEDDGIEIRYQITGNDNWTKEPHEISIEVTVNNTKGELDTSSIIITKNGKDITNTITKNGGTFTITTNESATYTVSAKNSKGEQSKPRTIRVNAKVDTTAPTIDSINAKVDGLEMKISATATDDQSGIKNYTYSIQPTSGIPAGKETEDFSQGETVTINATEENTYTISVTAIDNCDNESEAKTKDVITIEGGVEKHIKTASGPKKVNTKDIYGTKVTGYSCDRTDVEWQIFYIDETDDNRIYLIAVDYATPPITKASIQPIRW